MERRISVRNLCAAELLRFFKITTRNRRLPVSWDAGNLSAMSTVAQTILEQIKALPGDQQREICAEVLQLEARHRAWEEQRARLREMQSRHTGRGLLQALLDERTQEGARG